MKMTNDEGIEYEIEDNMYYALDDMMEAHEYRQDTRTDAIVSEL